MAKNLVDLPLGAKFKFGSIYDEPIIWKVSDKHHDGYPENSVTLVTENMIKALCFDAKEPSNSQQNRQSSGNERYAYSNIRQWLNSDASAGQWYTPQHGADAPPNASNVSENNGQPINPYEAQEGFLCGFTSEEKKLLLPTTITVKKNSIDGGGSESCTDKILLMSCNEVGFDVSAQSYGKKLSIFSDDSSRSTSFTPAASKNNDYPNSLNTGYWLRDFWATSGPYGVNASGRMAYLSGFDGAVGLRPLCNLPDDLLVSEYTDEDGCYVIFVNSNPSVPASITFGDPHAGKPLQITCEASTDPDGNPITYIWERQIDSGGWTQIGSGAETSITDTVPSSGTNYNVRVKARDSEGAESGYRTGSAKAIIYNQPPTIPGVPQYKYPIPGEEMPVKWQASTDPESGAVTYIVETKLGDGEWTQARETPETSCLVSVPQVSAVETMITVRVKAKDQEGAESAYSTGETVEILYHKVIRKIPWQRGKPFKARQYTYNGKKQYQTMREGALAGIEAEP